jgi:hypothetical protein
MSTVPGAAASFDQVFLCQLIDQQHHAAGQNAQESGETLLIRAGHSRDKSKDAGMRGGNSEMRNSLGETIGGVRAELSDQKSRAGGALGVRTHRQKREFKKLFEQCNSSLYE